MKVFKQPGFSQWRNHIDNVHLEFAYMFNVIQTYNDKSWVYKIKL
jgi:hypothetical protein